MASPLVTFTFKRMVSHYILTCTSILCEVIVAWSTLVTDLVKHTRLTCTLAAQTITVKVLATSRITFTF